MSLERYDFINNKWNNKSLIFGEILQDLFYIHGHLFIVPRYEDHLHVSHDNGQTFSKVKVNLINSPRSHEIQNKIVGFKKNLILKAEKAYLISKDNGDSWSIFNFNNPLGYHNILDIGLFNQQFLITCIDTNLKLHFITTTDLLTWSELPVKDSPEFFDFNGLNIIGDQLFFSVITRNGCKLYKYELNSPNLVETKGLPDLCFHPTVKHKIIEQNGLFIFCTYDGDFVYYKSTDNGYSWAKVIDEFNGNPYLFFLDIAIKDDKLYGASRFVGVLETNLGIVKTEDLLRGNKENIKAIPNPNSGIFELYGNFLELSNTDVVKIYNLQGQCVFELKDNLYPGYPMNLNNLNPGLYFLKLGTSDNLVCKLLIQK